MPAAVSKVDAHQIDYSTYAPQYDAARHLGKRNAYLERIRFRAFLKLIDSLPRNATILDVACGTGRGLGYLLRAGFTEIAGLDYTPSMLEFAARNLQAEFPEHPVPLTQGDAFHLPCADGEFDCVISMNFLHMFRLDLQQQLIAEMRRVCVPEGLIVSEFESIHKGLFFSRYPEQRRLKTRTKFNSIWEIRRMFGREQFSSVKCLGAVLPKAYLLLENTPRLGEVVESVSFLPGFRWLAERIIVAARPRRR